MERTAMGSSEYTRMLSREGVGGGGSYMTAEKEQGKRGKGPFRHATALSPTRPDATKPHPSFYCKADNALWHVPSRPTVFLRLCSLLFSMWLLVMELQWSKPHFASLASIRPLFEMGISRWDT